MIHFDQCGAGCSVRSNADPQVPGSTQPTAERPYTIDIHAHVVVPSIEKLVTGHAGEVAEVTRLARGMGNESSEHNARIVIPAVAPKLTGIDHRLSDMTTMGIDRQVISPSPRQYYYWADRDLARALVREQNEAIAGLCDAYADRFTGLGNVSLQHPNLAAEQLEVAIRQLGLVGVEISTSVDGVDLDDPALEPFWLKANELACIVFIHPLGTSLGDRLDRYYLSNVIGQPVESTIALSKLIFSGTLDRCPDVKLVAAHGGGYLPTYIGRSDHAFRVRPESRRCLRPPRDYLKQIWFDSLVYDATAVRHLLDRVGVSQVVVGTDYPFDMGDYSPHRLIGDVPGLSTAERLAIFSGNAAALIHPPAPRVVPHADSESSLGS